MSPREAISPVLGLPPRAPATIISMPKQQPIVVDRLFKLGLRNYLVAHCDACQRHVELDLELLMAACGSSAHPAGPLP